MSLFIFVINLPADLSSWSNEFAFRIRLLKVPRGLIQRDLEVGVGIYRVGVGVLLSVQELTSVVVWDVTKKHVPAGKCEIKQSGL